MSEQFVFKQGKGKADNSARWKVCFDTQDGRYTAELRFGTGILGVISLLLKRRDTI